MIKVPNNWANVSFQQYTQILDLPSLPNDISDEEAYSFNLRRTTDLLCIFSGLTPEQIDNAKPQDVVKAIEKLSFMNEEIPKVKVTHKIKTNEEISYKNLLDYINYSKRKHSYRFMPEMVALFFKDISAEDVRKMPVDYVMTCFFLLARKAGKNLRISIFRTAMQLMKHLLREKLGLRKKQVE